jgi:hypothetical protein
MEKRGFREKGGLENGEGGVEGLKGLFFVFA